MSAAKHAHAATKDRQHREAAVSLKTKKGQTSIILAPTPMLFAKVVLRDGTRGSIVGYTGSAGNQTYILQDTWGRETKITRDMIASYK